MGFLSGFEFGHLVAPSDVAEFLERHWNRRPLLEHRRLPDFYDGLLTIDDVDRVLAGNSHAGAQRRGGELDIDVAIRRLEQGAALVLDDAQRHMRTLALVCRVVHAALGFACSATVEITMPGNKPRPPAALDAHAFMLQVDGRRHWLVEGPADGPPPPGGGEFVMEAGDFLYLPPRWSWQHRTTGDRSIVAVLKLVPPRWVDMTDDRALADDPTLSPELAEPLPPGWLRMPRAELVAEFGRRWRQADDLMAVEAAAAQLVGAAVRAFPTDLSGRLTATLSPREITAGTVFGARNDLLWTIERTGGATRLIAGPLTLDLHDGAGDAVAFCLRTPRYGVDDLPGDLDAVGRRALMDRLERNVLVRRISG